MGDDMIHELCPLCIPHPTIGCEDVNLQLEEIGIIHWIEDDGFKGEGFCTKCKKSVYRCGICKRIIEASKSINLISPKEQHVCIQCYNIGVLTHDNTTDIS